MHDDLDQDQHRAYKENLVDLLEVFDNSIPVVGCIMDLPVVDRFEREFVGAFVDATMGISAHDVYMFVLEGACSA